VKAKVSLSARYNSHSWRGGRVPFNINLGTRWRPMVSLTSRPHYPPEPIEQEVKVGNIVGLVVTEQGKISYSSRDSNPRQSAAV